MDIAISNINVGGLVNAAGAAPTPVSGSRSVQQVPPMGPSAGSIDSEAARQLAREVQLQMESMNISLSFSTYGKKGEDVSVIVTDKDTGKVIREIPPKEMQDLQTKIGELIGLIFNHSA